MKKLLILTLFATACATNGVVITYRNYEPKWAILEYRPVHKSQPKFKADREREIETAMREFCAPEPYRRLAEGTNVTTDGFVSTPVGNSVLTAPTQSSRPYIKFACGVKN